MLRSTQAKSYRVNLGAANTTFRQLMGNGLSYRVPAFQRDYSWRAEEWDDLWQDIVALFDDDAEPSAAHYMGYLVLRSEDQRNYEVIDGQQRITTLSLLVLAAIAELRRLAESDDEQEPNNRRAAQLRTSYIGYLDPVTLVSRAKLTLNRSNDSYYQNQLVPLGHLPLHGINASEKLLRQAFLWFKARVANSAGGSGEATARLVDRLADGLVFTTITVADGVNAFKVFETLNARGVRLSATDLLKNLLFSVVVRDGTHESEIKALEQRWEAVVGLLGGESFPEFLRVFWNSRHALVRKASLFKTVSTAVRDRGAAFALVRSLEEDARIYAALRSPEDGVWNVAERRCLQQLKLFGVRQPLAVLLAAYSRFAEQDRRAFERFLAAIVALSFRYNVICRRQANEQEAAYNRIARALAEQRMDIDEAVAALRPIYPENREFRAAFADAERKADRHRRLVKFMLLQLERRESGQLFDFESDAYNVEHILPVHPADEDWLDFDDGQRDECVHRLGNMTLLEAKANRVVGNSSYEEKRQRYLESDFELTRRVANEFETWTPEKVRVRQDWMARQASDIWRIDFPLLTSSSAS